MGAGRLEPRIDQGRLPTGGWAFLWVGDPDLGDDWQQPGGWMYNLLPYMEQQALHDLQVGKTGQTRKDAATQMIQTPLGILHCPLRRPAALYPNGSYRSYYYTNAADNVAKSDYAANGGDVYCTSNACGTYSSPYTEGTEAAFGKIAANATGVMYPASRTTMAQITDGASNTYLFGEKYLSPDQYYQGTVLSGSVKGSTTLRVTTCPL